MDEENLPRRIDTLITGGIIVDGTGAEAIHADVAIAGNRIIALGDLSASSAAETIDASGNIVAPGFIDVHTHDDRLLLENPDMTPKVSQGVTTVVTGNCGVSLAPYIGAENPPAPMNLLGDKEWYRFEKAADYAAALVETPAATNSVTLCGHSSLRASVMDDLARPATTREIDRMSALLEEAFDAGFAGLSTGLAYPTASAAPTEEVIELAKIAAHHNGIHTTHMRDEEDDVLDAIDETVRIGCEAHVGSVISHHKVCGQQNYGRTRETLARINEAQNSLTLNLDVYPYIASSTVLLKAFTQRAERVMITWSKPYPEMTGRDLSDVALSWNVSEDDACDRLNPAGAVYFQMHEEDLMRVMAYRDTMIGSDGLPHDKRPHPRLWGTFPRVLGHYARDEKVFTMEQAVHRMTSVPARVFGLKDRGSIVPGAFADLVIFNPDTVRDRATFDDPVQPAEGIERVMTNGQWIWQDNNVTGSHPGSHLRHLA